MYSFIPQLLIFISIVGIIVIVLRRSPGVIFFFRRTPVLKIPARGLSILWRKLWASSKILLRKIWDFVLEVKELSRTKALPRISKSISKINFPKKVKFPALKLSPRTNLALKQAEESMQKGDYQDAERKFIELIKKDPKGEAAYLGLAKLYFAQDKYSEAAETYEFLIRHHPDNEVYHAGLAQVYQSMKIYDQAIEEYETAAALAPDGAEQYVDLGRLLEAKNHLGEAILNYRKAVSLDKKNVDFLMILAEALVKNDQEKDAENVLEEILQVEPTNSEAREKLMKLKF